MKNQYLALTGLFVAFGALCFLLWLTRGRNAWLLRHKLKVGAMILSLSSLAISGCKSPTEVTCYVPAPQDEFIMNGPFNEQQSLLLLLSEGHRLSGSLRGSTLEAYSYTLVDMMFVEVGRGALHAVDGAFDENEEPFFLDLDESIPAGFYELRFHVESLDELGEDPGNGWDRFPLEIRD